MKKILYICDQSPFDNSFGAQQRTSLLCDALCEKGQVDLVCFTLETLPQTISRPNCTVKYFGELQTKVHSRIFSRLKKLLNIFLSFSPYSVYNKNRDACKSINNLLKNNHYDLIVIRYIKNAFMCGLFCDIRIIVDVDDLPEQSILSYADAFKLSRIKYLQYKFYAKRAKFHTNHFLKRIKHSFFSNENQCLWKNSSYLPNIPFPISKRDHNLTRSFPDDNELVVLFVGFMLHSPNIQGVEHFVENIWHKVKDAIPSAIFKIAGKGVTIEQKIVWEEYEGVQVLGYVSDIYNEYRKCKVVIVPIYYGAGSNIKVLEAMSMRRASVITDFAAKAFENDLIDGNNILVARNDQDFANKVIQLLSDKNYNMNIAINGEKTIEEKYSYSVFIESVNKYIF
jgi:glycosyltransferase involved in cell wall biosynthesis